ncbi:MAG: hypothetical protein HC880_05670 [Bacteroidia bacterium]|nr:hypothetical protein [Bacteroidia bacterium]
MINGKERTEIAANLDVVPTLMDLAGIAPPDSIHLDGKSLKPLLMSQNPNWPDRNLYQKYSLTTLRSNKPDPFPGAVMRNQRYKMVNGNELYDLQNDPGETTNLADQQPSLLQKMNASFLNWWQGVMPPEGFSLMPIAVGYPEAPLVKLIPHLGRASANLSTKATAACTAKPTLALTLRA